MKYIREIFNIYNINNYSISLNKIDTASNIINNNIKNNRIGNATKTMNIALNTIGISSNILGITLNTIDIV